MEREDKEVTVALACASERYVEKGAAGPGRKNRNTWVAKGGGSAKEG